MKSIIKYDPKLKIRKELVEDPIYVYVNEFDEASVKKFVEDMNKAHNTGQPIIPIIIDSYGGMVHGALAMIACVESATVPVATICIGKAMSAGSILLSCGTEGYRYCDPNAAVMLHDVSSTSWGKIEEIKANTQEAERLHKLIFAKMAKNCGHKDPEYFTKLLHHKSHAEVYLTPVQAKKHNIINHIKVPHFTTEVKVETSFQ